MTAPVIHRVTQMDLICSDWDWPFASQRRAEIDAHFTVKQAEKPQMFNGRVLLARNLQFTSDRFCADYFETDFASFLAWRDWGFPDRDVVNGFGMGALRSADGAFVLGEMGQHTANAGKIYFPSGTPDLSDLRGPIVDMPGSVARETGEEVGLMPADYRAADHWDIVVAGPLTAIIRILHVDVPGDVLRTKIEANLDAQTDRELSAIHLVRSTDDFSPMMPEYIRAFLAAKL